MQFTRVVVLEEAGSDWKRTQGWILSHQTHRLFLFLWVLDNILNYSVPSSWLFSPSMYKPEPFGTDT